MDEPFRTTIVIVTHARPELLRRTLESLARCTLPDVAVRTIVVENGGASEAATIVCNAARHLNATRIAEESKIKSVGLNRALAECDDELIVFFDDDVRFEANVLEAYVAVANRFGPGNYFGGPVKPDYDEAPPGWLRRYLPHSARGWSPNPHLGAISTEFRFVGFNWAAFGCDLRASGGFSRSFGPGTPIGVGDESFLQRRMVERGCRGCYVEDAVVWHFVPRERCSPAWTLRRAYGSGCNAGIKAAYQLLDQGRRVAGGRLIVQRLRGWTGRRDLWNLFLLREEGVFWARYVIRWLQAYAVGLRVAKNRRPLDDDNWNGIDAEVPLGSEQEIGGKKKPGAVLSQHPNT